MSAQDQISTTPAIAIEHLTKRFDGNTAVDDVSIRVPPGAFLVLVGPSGCGKSTLLRMLAGLEPPTEGQISFGGKIVSGGASGVQTTAAARDAGLVFQSYALWPHKTVEGNIDWPLKVAGWSKQKREERINEVLKFLDIEALRNRYPTASDVTNKDGLAAPLSRQAPMICPNFVWVFGTSPGSCFGSQNRIGHGSPPCLSIFEMRLLEIVP